MAGRTQMDRTPSRSDLLDLVTAAHRRRGPLHADPRQTAYRLFHGHGEGVPGLTIDRLGEILVVTLREEHEALIEDILDALIQLDPSVTCVVTRRRHGRGSPRVARGERPTAPVTVIDNGLTFEVEPLSTGNAGLYLDARPARAWLLANAANRRVLNLFAFTGSLGIAAAAAGATWVMHVELQKRALRRLRRNHDINALPIDDRDLVRADLYPHLRRLARQGRAFDAIILDPPPQVPGRGPRGQDYTTLVALAVGVLAPGGWLLCFFSDFKRTRQTSEAEVLAAAPHALDVIWRGTSGVDFPEADPETKLRVTAFSRPRAKSGADE